MRHRARRTYAEGPLRESGPAPENAAPHLAQQQLKSAAVMIMRHDPSRDTPEPFNAVGVRIISRRIHQV
jgi:hypothetical protein